MSAKWRRYKKRSRRSHVFRDFDKVKNRKNPEIFHIKNSRIKRGAYPYKYRLPKISRGRRWKEPEPLIDILEENNEITVVAQFAGFKRENLKIHVKNQRLTLSAEASDRKYYKSLNLPKKVIPNTIRTTYKNGVLEIRLRKAIEEKAVDKVVG
ncbi:MAG: Hsp20/alpha crystallin family protein [Candidatus Bathyarchaeota archaeon]|nr:Hsp20/alpha crystallin family protein [Candidatus Bathyarchaeota archaeon]